MVSKSPVPRSGPCHFRRRPAGFTLLEVLVGVAVMTMILVLTFKLISSTSQLWKTAKTKVGSSQSARAAFEAMNRNLSQATLQTYFGYADGDGVPVPLINPSIANGATLSKMPKDYLRASELHFVTGPADALFSLAGVSPRPKTAGCAVFFQMPAGVTQNQTKYRANGTLLNSIGYFIEYDKSLLPDNLTLRGRSAEQEKLSYRYRLMEAVQPAEKNAIYRSTLSSNSGNKFPDYVYDLDWIKSMDLGADPAKSTEAQPAVKHVVAENIIALVILPRQPLDPDNPATDPGDELAPNYHYDSRSWEKDYKNLGGKARIPSTDPSDPAKVDNSLRNQLPPILEIVMVAIDESSASRLAEQAGPSPPFEGGRYDLSGLFKNAGSLDDDLKTLEARLTEWKINYHIFRSEVPIAAAKWDGNG